MLRNPRTAVLVATASLALAGLPLLVGGPAQAVSASLTYHCTTDNVLLSTADLSAVDRHQCARDARRGDDGADHGDLRRDVPDSVADVLRSNGVASVQGSSVATGTVDGAARNATLAIPRTNLPPDGDAHVVGTGAGGTITAGAVGIDHPAGRRELHRQARAPTTAPAPSWCRRSTSPARSHRPRARTCSSTP